MKFKSSSLITHRSAAQLTVAKNVTHFCCPFCSAESLCFRRPLASARLSSLPSTYFVDDLSVAVEHFDRHGDRTVSVFGAL
jgi:hypothetical protein